MSTGKASETQPELREFTKNSVIKQSDKWWRTESPPPARFGDDPHSHVKPQREPYFSERKANDYKVTQIDIDYAEPPRNGVFSYQRWPQYFTTNQVGLAPLEADPRRHEKRDTMGCISGYSGFIPGKIAGNCVGGTFAQSNVEATTHLNKTRQSNDYPEYTRTKFIVKEQ
eukprot:GDKJ01016672.1.p1 GENE.GDKJ01016672.1~~GDKJ01016672.1.p1  ORF type:complete len:170 (+),score=27.86 GDKJ01016672.1:36-545(+)